MNFNLSANLLLRQVTYSKFLIIKHSDYYDRIWIVEGPVYSAVVKFSSIRLIH